MLLSGFVVQRLLLILRSQETQSTCSSRIPLRLRGMKLEGSLFTGEVSGKDRKQKQPATE